MSLALLDRAETMFGVRSIDAAKRPIAPKITNQEEEDDEDELREDEEAYEEEDDEDEDADETGEE